MIGKSLGHYDVTAKLGEGGMGQVYRATDTRLGRDVAIKLLPLELSDDTERLARLEREARTLASLNHPNVAGIHGLEEAALPDDASGRHVRFLVMELVEGPSLAERIESGPMAVEDAVPVAVGIARGLAAAHEMGIVHRDVKPANIHLATGNLASGPSSSLVKVLDFGLAKPTQEDESTDLTRSPTILATSGAGVILGTAPYMSPEQARGLATDKRTDVWAFGCVLYEMLTGRRVFDGTTVSDTIAAILRAEPDWDTLPAQTSRPVVRLLQRCLTKDPERRLRDLNDAALDLEEALDSPDTEASTTDGAARSSRMAWIPWLIATISIVAAVWGLTHSGPSTSPDTVAPMQVEVALPESAPLQLGEHPALALSPTERYLAFVGRVESGGLLHLQDLSTGEVTPLAGTEFAIGPVFSPNEEWIAFSSTGRWARVSTRSGVVVPIGGNSGGSRGATWLDDDTLVLGARTGLVRLDVAAGTSESMSVIAEDELSHYWPFALPGSKAILFVAGVKGADSYDAGRILAYDVESGEKSLVLDGGTTPRYVNGHLIFARGGMLFGAPFDAETLQVTGPSRVLVDGVMMRNDSGGTQYSTSTKGSLVYAAGGAVELTTKVVRVDRSGNELPFPALGEAVHNDFELSPDGNRLAFARLGPNDDIWVSDLSRESMTRVTFGESGFGSPTWSPNGEWIAYSSDEDRIEHAILIMRADGSESRHLVRNARRVFPASWVNSTLVFTQVNEETHLDIRRLEVDPISGKAISEPTDVLATDFSEGFPVLSPDGRWMAYVSNESGTYEVYIRSMQGAGGKIQVSTGGGGKPCWSPDGRELFWTGSSSLMAAAVTTQPRLSVSRAETLFEEPSGASVARNFFVEGDGQSFLLLKDAHAGVLRRVTLVLGWGDRLGSDADATR